jgi:hypothetical protein
MIHYVETKSGGVPKYTFTIQLGDQACEPPRSAILHNDAAALDYVCDMARELKNGGSYDNPNLLIKVRDKNDQIIFSIPLLAGCA